MVSARSLRKSYGKVVALKGVDFDVGDDELFGIIGPDGAGKTTLFRILVTLLKSDGGTAIVDGLDTLRDYRRLRERVGYMPGRFSLYQDLTVLENLSFFATVFNTTIQENYELIADIYRQIEPFKNRRAGALSGGMKQKLALCCALVHKPRVLFLDEPTTGVDPVSREEFWGMLKRLRREGITILVSTPYMDEASLCDRIALMRDGEYLKTDTPRSIADQFDKKLWALRADGMFNLLQDLRSCDLVESCFAFGDSHHVTFKDDRAPLEALRTFLLDKGHPDVDIQEIRPSVEDCFMALAPKEDA